MSDRYRPSGPKSSRYSEGRDIERERERNRDRERDQKDRDDYRGGNYKSQYSNSSRDANVRDYYAGPPLSNSKRQPSDRDGDNYRSGSKPSVASRGGRNGPGAGPHAPSRDSVRGSNGFADREVPGGPKLSRQPLQPSASSSSSSSSSSTAKGRPPPSGLSGKPPIGPKGTSIPTGPSKFRPSGPSGYKGSKESTQDKGGRDTYRPAQKRQALPPQESTVGGGNKRPHEATARTDDYRKRHHYEDDYDYDQSYSSSKSSYRSTYGSGQGYGGRDDKYASSRINTNANKAKNAPPLGPHGSQRGAPPKAKGKGKENGGPGNQKKPRKLLTNSQIYLIRTIKPIEVYARVQQVGEGTYGKVYKAKNSITNEFVALKKLRLESEREGFPITAMREIKLLQSFNHPNIVGLLEMMVEQNQIYMIFDYMDHDLTGLLTHPDLKLEECHKKFIFKQLMEGLNYLHRKRVIHRDIKGSNILLDNIGVVKIADFGLARTMKTTLNGELPDYTNRVITIWYRPPELLLGSTDYGREVDIWGVGCLLIELYSKVAAFQGFDEVGQLQKIFNVMGTPTLDSWPSMNELPWFEMLKPKVNKASIFGSEYKPIMSDLSYDLAENLLMLDPKRRLNAEQALKHPYFWLDPKPEPLYFLKELKGEWHEFETKKRRRMERKRKQEMNNIITPGVQLVPNVERSVPPQSVQHSAEQTTEQTDEPSTEQVVEPIAEPSSENINTEPVTAPNPPDENTAELSIELPAEQADK